MPRTSKTLFLYPIEADGSKLHVVLVTQHKQISGPAVASGIMMSSKKKNEASDDKMTFAFLALNTEFRSNPSSSPQTAVMIWFSTSLK